MSIFEFVSVAVSIILGLAIARLLSAAIDLFSHRDRIRFHWAPIVWAVIMFSLLVLFWWQLFGANELIEQWTFVDFLLAIACTVLMYIACGLILPRQWSEESIDLFNYFAKDGRWGVAAYSAFYLVVIPYNIRLYEATGDILALNLVQALLAAGAVLARSEKWIGVATIAFAIVYVSNVLAVIFPEFQ